jgi:hypothetical protein
MKSKKMRKIAGGLMRRLRMYISVHLKPRVYYGIEEYDGARPHALVNSRTVKYPRKFGNKFQKGDRVYQIHLNAANPRRLIELLHQIVSHFAVWQAQGIKGIYGDTPNLAITRFFKKLGAHIMPLNKSMQTNVRIIYREGIEEDGYAKKYESAPVQRIVLNFEDWKAIHSK